MKLLSALAVALGFLFFCAPLLLAQPGAIDSSVQHQAEAVGAQTGEEKLPCCPDGGVGSHRHGRERPDSHVCCDWACYSWWTVLGDVGPFLSGIALLAAACIAYYNLVLPTRRREERLIDTVCHHAAYAMENLEKQSATIDPVRKKIQQDEDDSYHPYVVDVAEANLTYSQVIEVLRSVKEEKDREKILDYYYSQAELHAVTKVFSSELVQNFPKERKLGLWEIFGTTVQETLCSAKMTKSILEKLQRRKGG